MSTAILIAISFSLGFFVESIIGFGGGLIAYAILGFFVDLKTMIIAGLYIGSCSAAYIAYTDFDSFNKKVYKKTLPLAFIGTILGVFIFSTSDVSILKILLGALLLFLGLRLIFVPKQKQSIEETSRFKRFKKSLPKILQNKLLFIGGISQGAFGLGGPFIANAMHNDFQNKSQLRTTLAVFFITCNFIRLIQLLAQKQIESNFYAEIWWTLIPVFFAIKLGHHIHKKINDKMFRLLIAIMTLLSGIKFLIF